MLPALILSLFAMSVAYAEVEVIDADAGYPEGPLWNHGVLLYVEYARDDVKAWDGKRARVYWRKDHCGASGLIAYRGDHVLVACYDGNYLVEIDALGHEVRTISRDTTGKPFAGPNDFAADGRGGVYFSASGVYDIKAPITGAILHLAADGQQLREVAATLHYPNGLTLSKDGRQLLVAEMLAGRILAFPLAADGTLGPRVVWARLKDLAAPTAAEDAYNGPDGLKLGADGNYYIAQNGSGRVLVVSDEKKLVRLIRVPARFVTNVAFGPGGAGTVYITAAFDQWKAPFPGAVYRWRP